MRYLGLTRTTRLLLLSIPLASALAAQSHPAGYQNVSITNTTQSGSSALAVRIYYPATQNGLNAPIRAQTGGYPVVVFLHGLSVRAAEYARAGAALATSGFVAVLNDTASLDADLQVKDGIALFASLIAENKRTGSAFVGIFDMAHAGVAGHSMGGGSTVRVLAQNPGYLAGFCFAPWNGQFLGQGPDWTKSAPAVKTPLAILHGRGDTLVSWSGSGKRFYDSATAYTGIRAFVLLDSAATHSNIVNLPSNPSTNDIAINAAGLQMITGWFDRFLRGGAGGLESVLGRSVRDFARLSSITHEYAAPELWRAGSARLGQSGSINLGGESGNGGIYAAAGNRKTVLPFGIVELDPNSILPVLAGKLDSARLLRVVANVPNVPQLVGTRLWFQAVTDGGRPGLQLSGAFDVVIEK